MSMQNFKLEMEQNGKRKDKKLKRYVRNDSLLAGLKKIAFKDARYGRFRGGTR